MLCRIEHLTAEPVCVLSPGTSQCDNTIPLSFLLRIRQSLLLRCTCWQDLGPGGSVVRLFNREQSCHHRNFRMRFACESGPRNQAFGWVACPGGGTFSPGLHAFLRLVANQRHRTIRLLNFSESDNPPIGARTGVSGQPQKSSFSIY